MQNILLEEGSLEELPGVGKKTAEKLRNAGFVSVTSIKKAKPRDLSEKTGLGIRAAKKIIKAARSAHISETGIRSRFSDEIDIFEWPYQFESWCMRKGRLSRLVIFVIALMLTIVVGLGFKRAVTYAWIIGPQEQARRQQEYDEIISQKEADWRHNNPLLAELNSELSARTSRKLCIVCGRPGMHLLRAELHSQSGALIRAHEPRFYACNDHIEGMRILSGSLPSLGGDVGNPQRQRLTAEASHREYHFFEYFKANYEGGFDPHDLARTSYEGVFGRPWMNYVQNVGEPGSLSYVYDQWGFFRRIGSILLGIIVLAFAMAMVISAACLFQRK